MPTLSNPRRVLLTYGVAVVGLLFTVVIALVLPTFLYEPHSRLDCSRQLNTMKAVMILLGLLVTFVGVLVAAFRSYLAES